MVVQLAVVCGSPGASAPLGLALIHRLWSRLDGCGRVRTAEQRGERWRSSTGRRRRRSRRERGGFGKREEMEGEEEEGLKRV